MDALTAFGGSLAKFVGKANPAAVQRFTLAADDLQAVIGRALTPVLEKLTVLVQRLGNAFASLSPTTQKFIAGLTGGAGLGAVLAASAVAVRALLAALGPIPIVVGLVGGAIAGVAANMSSAKALGDAFSRVLGVLGTAVEAVAGIAVPLLTTALEFVTPLIEEFAKGLTYLAGVITDVLAELGLIDAAQYDPNAKSSTGAAVRQAQIGDLSSFANKNYTSAYGGATKDEIPSKQLSQLEQINKKLDGLGYLKDGTRKEDRQVLGSSALGRATHPFEKGTDGKTNFDRGLEVIGRNQTVAALFSLFD